ncbi:hypothetical protein QBC39DRAFT_385616 [Podospora conica]|nr:hypothetical protein QBC39DRAFT_385616 [Schizothecium conicum]
MCGKSLMKGPRGDSIPRGQGPPDRKQAQAPRATWRRVPTASVSAADAAVGAAVVVSMVRNDDGETTPRDRTGTPRNEGGRGGENGEGCPSVRVFQRSGEGWQRQHAIASLGRSWAAIVAVVVIDNYLAARLDGEGTRPGNFDEDYLIDVEEWARRYVPFAFVRDMLACNPTAVSLFFQNRPIHLESEEPPTDTRSGLDYLRAEVRDMTAFDMVTNPIPPVKRLLTDIRTFAPNDDESVTSTMESLSAFMEKYLPDTPAIVLDLAPEQSSEEWASTFELANGEATAGDVIAIVPQAAARD